MKTFPAPPSATIFEYTWNLNAADAAKAIGAFQDFVQTNIPQEFAAEIVIGSGSVQGNLSWGLTGGWYGPANQFRSVIAPFLAKMPKPASTSLTPGTYINSVQFLGGLGSLNTSSLPDGHDTFYAKSLMTPEASPMSNAARTTFMNYLANDGFTANTVLSINLLLNESSVILLPGLVCGNRTIRWNQFGNQQCYN